MDNKGNSISVQQRTGHTPTGVRILPFSMAWILNDDTVLAYGFNGLCMVCGFLDHPSAVKLLAPGYGVHQGQTDRLED